MTYPYTFLYLYILLVLYQTVLSPVGVRTETLLLIPVGIFLPILFYISNLHISLFLVHIYILSYHVFHLTLTKRLVNLVQQFSFSNKICEPNAIKLHMVRF